MFTAALEQMEGAVTLGCLSGQKEVLSSGWLGNYIKFGTPEPQVRAGVREWPARDSWDSCRTHML